MAVKQQFERKHFFIDRRFQGRYMLTFLIPMLILLVFMLFTLYVASQSIIGTTTSIICKDVELKVDIQLQQLQERPPTVEMLDELLNDIKYYIRTFSSNTKYRKALMTSLMLVFGVGVFMVIIQMVLLTVYFSHRVAGPVYRLEKMCHKLIDGDYTDNVILRKGDEMQNLAHLFNTAVETTRNRLIELRDEKDPQKRMEITSTYKV